MQSSPYRWYGLSLFIWLVIGSIICVAWAIASTNQSRARFEQDARILHRVLSQRAEQHEAVLSSLVALERSQVGKITLTEFAVAMQSRYPQVELIQHCRQNLGCSALGKSTVNIELNVEQQFFQKARLAVPSRPLVVSAKKARFALLQADNQSVFVLWVNANRFVGADEFPHPKANLKLSLVSERVNVFERQSKQSNQWLEATVLPQFKLEKKLGSDSQPFTLYFEHSLSLSELPIWWMLGFYLVGTGLTLFLARVLRSAHQARLERRQAETALGRERARAEGTVRAVSEALLACDREGLVTLVNPAAQTLLGADLVLLLGQPLSSVMRFQGSLSGSPLAGFWESFWRQPKSIELPEGATLLDHQGQARLIEGGIAPLHDGQGQLVGAVFACRDLGPFRKRMLEALEKSERRVREHEAMLAHVGRISTLSEIAAGVAHELNQPLTAILSHSQASLRLLEDELNLPQVRRSLQSCAEQARRASQILERLRAQAARQPLRRERIDLRQSVENVRVLTDHELRQRNILFETQFGIGRLEIEGDAIGLEQVLHNLVRNAIEAVADVSPERRKILLSASLHVNTVSLEVRDFGQGISEAILSHLFTPFASNKPSGLGLGLSLSQTLIQSMGGTLAGNNMSDGGARFVLVLPALLSEVAYVN